MHSVGVCKTSKAGASPWRRPATTRLFMLRSMRCVPPRRTRCRMRLERSRLGWLIASVDPATVVPTAIPYGTHISKTVGEPAAEKEEP